MNTNVFKWILPLTVLVYTFWNALELVNAWIYAPWDLFGWLPFLIWLIPVFIIKNKRQNSFFLWIALGLTLLGNLGSLNAFRYFGFSSAIAFFVPFSWVTIFWWVCSVGWMPAFGWLGSHYFSEYVFITRCLLVGTASLFFLLFEKRRGDD